MNEEQTNINPAPAPENTPPTGQYQQSQPSHEQPAKPRLPIKRIVTILIIALIVALLYYFRGVFIAATVNGTSISRLEVLRMLEKQSGKTALDSLIAEKLVLGEAKKRGISVSKEETYKEIAGIERQVSAQGNTLEAVLSLQGITREDLEAQITLRQTAEKLIADQLQVTDEEIRQYIKEFKVEIPAGKEAEFTEQIRNELKAQKFSQKIQELITSLRGQAQINYFTDY
ncbi:MAG: parvulin-like peptidyl-prolyl isomerase [Parcubacteria group bacterium Gr01-1014_29]|nr:MAG: parvulin-like peptidyl-prolyl isomerase [Parcubacteria group bacterium Gr01-1014_29]